MPKTAGDSAPLEARVREALQAVNDPEIPALSLEDLGMVYDVGTEGTVVHIRLLPTFVGCPAMHMIQNLVARQVEQLDGVTDVHVSFVMDVPWTSHRITVQGRKKLRDFGIAPPPPGFAPEHVPECPYCGAAETSVVSLFGPTACRRVYYCKHCQQPFEGMKFV